MMRFVGSSARFGVLAAILLHTAASATVEISVGPADPFARDLTARARWGGSGFETIINNNGGAVAATQMNPAGAPVWLLGQAYDFRMAWNVATGTLTWQIDFNRNGSFSVAETSSFVKPENIGYSFQYIEMTMLSAQNGSNSSGITVNNLSINGTSLGSFAQSGNTPLTTWFESTTGFADIEILGDLTFLRLSGNGNSVFSQERPRLEISLVGPGLVDEPVPEPAAWATLLIGFGVVGAVQRRRTRRLAA